jgi:hypothetical protein
MLPAHLIKLIDNCICTTHNEFVCALRKQVDDDEDDTINLSIYQQSPFVHLRHISLNLMAATDL